jgi:chromosome segregation ATPase
LDNEIEDKMNEWQDKNYEELTYKLEIELELNDAELPEVETKIKSLGNDLYSMAEVAQLWFNDNKGGDKYSNITDTYAQVENHVNSLNSAYANGEISQANYIEGLQESRDNVQGLIDNLLELDETMKNYYGETLSAGAE